MKKIKIKYLDPFQPKLEKISIGDWIDLRVCEVEGFNWDLNCSYMYNQGDVLKLKLGVAMELPKGYEAIIAPRSSTFTNWGFIQTNSIGVVDNSYCGDKDEWSMQVIAMRDGSIKEYERVCQFRIQKIQPEIEFMEVENLGNENRGGFGSTGK